MKSRLWVSALMFLAGCTGLLSAAQAGGPLGIDHRVTYDDHGIWARNYQLDLMYGMLAAEAGIALWEGGDTRLGKTAWQAIDTTAVAGVAALLMKKGFARERPHTTDNPNHWFSGGGNESFPSGEVTVVTSVVTPFVLEYGHDHPAVYALELLPLYDSIARVKTWGHWQTDVLAGFALASTVGFFMHQREMPLTLSVLPQGFQVGLSKRW
jgi:membrane-associated phospholipid phosphatase